MLKIIKATSIVILIMMAATVSYSDETLWGASSASKSGGGFITGWPSLEVLGGTGRPTQSLMVDVLNLSIGGNGPGWDENMSVAASCNVDNVTDYSCIGAIGTTAGSLMSLDGVNGAVDSIIISPDHTDDQWRWMCRDPNSPWAHQHGNAGDVVVPTFNKTIPIVIRTSNPSESYRTVYVDGSSGGFNCASRTGNLTTRTARSFVTSNGDGTQHFITDGVHVGPFASRWYAQRMLDASWMDQYPATLGVPNMIVGGFMESGCGAITAQSGAVIGQFQASNTTNTPGTDPVLGSGCRAPVNSGTHVETAQVPVVAGDYLTGQVIINSATAAADLTNRVITVSLRNQTGAVSPNTKFWIDGPTVGGKITSADDSDLAGLVDGNGDFTGEWKILAGRCISGCIVKFATKVNTGESTTRIRVAVGSAMLVNYDEIWLRKKVYQDFERHPIIADGKARIKVFTDSRGSTGQGGYIERFTGALDYMLGFQTGATSDNLRVGGSYRPNLHVTEQPTTIQFSISGTALGDFVGANDSYLRYNGTSILVPDQFGISHYLGDLMDGVTSYCVSFYGVNDQLTGASGRANPGFASNSASVGLQGDRKLFFGDQMRGFELAAEANGCIPIFIQDINHRSNTSQALTTDCHDSTSTDVACGVWFEDNWKQVLHEGLPNL